MKRLENKIALITGASSGIGKSIAQLFHKQGATVLLSDIKNYEGAIISEGLGENCDYLSLDVSDENDWINVSNYIKKKYGRLDILINNAGITGFTDTAEPQNPEDINIQLWEYIHTVNSTSIMLGCRYGIQLMKALGGSIVNISSRSGNIGVPSAVAYASSKASVGNYTKSVSLYCAEKKYNIRCNSVHPAAILTPMWDKTLGEGDEREIRIKQIEATMPLGSFGNPLDVAYGVLYLSSDESKYVTGIELNIDGGIATSNN
ncbi:SDR family oxidoreductase [Aequorivita antarctica]|uniref:SDR family oxidoreductase n=1 Tax=Aequorivita antarctica TaxID=153266 RepID=A0A5C6Z1D1_9FLAO|nr:SDR family oxidoreductase [Aequorivita antarctica]TXD73256.1 SDR family oxidoreductase [Aequorivita antarctica]SRX76009.1 3-beta-hydroxysteroid dehydrogenase [Aequorivita antarctica]